MDRKILYNLAELGMDDVPHWDILGFYRKKDRSVWVEFLYEGKKRRKNATISENCTTNRNFWIGMGWY